MPGLYVNKPGPVHAMDARVKLIFTLALILFIGLSPFKAWPAYILYLTLTLSIAVISGLGMRFMLNRSLFALPFTLAAVPLIFTGPDSQSILDQFDWAVIRISMEGCLRFLSIGLKSWISVQAAILLAATTRFPDILSAFNQMKAPRLLTAITGLMWRYLSVIIDEASRLMRARTCRSTAGQGVQHAGGSILWRARVTGGMAGNLLLRSLERSDRVYAAMLSRGYNGDLPRAETAELSKSDRLILAAGTCLVLLIWLLGMITGG